MQYLLKTSDLSIRKMEDDIIDYRLMAKWLSTREVLEYIEGISNPYDLDKVIKKYSPRTKGEEAVVPCIIEFDGKQIGYIQYYRIESDGYDVGNAINWDSSGITYGMDIFIGESGFWNRGIGTIVVKDLISYLFQKENADTVLIYPQTWNKRAIRCYEKAGFVPITVIENREMYDGEYKDSLIMSISFQDWNLDRVI